MAEKHWFDILNTSLVRESHRRGVLRAAGAFGTGLVFGSGLTTGTVAAKQKRKKKKGKKKPKPSPPPPCSGGACAAEPEWAGRPGQIDHCEFICRQCDGDDARDFCIVDGGVVIPGKVAVCCDEKSPCCGDECCPVGYNPDLKCCAGSCTDTSDNPSHCGDCDNACGDGQECRFGRCGCPQSCPQGKNCIHGDGSLCVERPTRPDCHCGCGPGYEYCQHRAGHWVCVSDCSLVT